MTTVIKAHKIRKLEKAIAGLIKYDSFLCPIRTNDPNFISHICFAMLSIISRIARGFGLLAVHLTIVRQHEGAMRIFESSFPRDTIVDVCSYHIIFGRAS
ncbi:uncharacterized protein N7473_007572 [Penicillium subrubescens]|uniref:uncharacterized protein n=1 Tax=Penicillium subrubescens TaxID=1316194 RepID=UPI0025454721|nr:uncharacterized protein N7473_007572 [Penicillium subrubescens]KAJ5891344.1 hypothetical protein N7473_007572 [Penicillium subrubescens]